MKANIYSFSAMGLGRTQEDILVGLETKLKELRGCTPDLVCFPEEVLVTGGDKNNPRWAENNQAALELMQRYAVELHTNIIIGLEEPAPAYPGKRYNTAFVIDRSGTILERYRKRYITFRQLGTESLPGGRVVTVDTDIGRIGLMVCFDVGWRDGWRELAEMGAQIVVWPSAYNGGNLLNAYAAVHMYYVVSSVWNIESRIIDPFGNTIAESTRWDPCVHSEIYPGAPIIHFDHHERKLPELRAEYGERIHLRVEGKGNMFELGINDDTLQIDEICKKHNLMTYQEYHDKSAADNAYWLAQCPEK